MRYLKILLISLILLFYLSEEGHPYLKTEGKNIVDAAGDTILLRGYGLGGWLVPEGYQLKIPGFGSPSSIRSMITELIGEDKTNQFYQQFRANYVNQADIEKIASWGFNSIRLPFNYRLLTPEDQPGVFLEEGFQIIDLLLDWCEANQLYLILDMHCAPGGQNSDNISDSDGIEARLWTEPENQTRTIDIWKRIAERYANEEWIGGYDLINEPVLPSGYSNAQLRSLYMRITQAIREVDQNHIIYIEGNWYATDFYLLTPPFDANLVYSFHKYWNEVSHGSIQQYLNIRNSYSVPLWLGETGENSNTWFYDTVCLMEENNIGWNWWTHKKIETITSPYSAPISTGYQTILDYWNGTGSKPSVDYAFAALMEMADNLKLENCDYRPGVVRALMDREFGQISKPVKWTTIPGKISCSDYDIGRQNIAYFDMDFQNVRGLGSGDRWNAGYQYRNDGVDIEMIGTNDECNVGWIEPGEWMKYTVVVNHSGTYTVRFDVSAPGTGNKLQLYLNDQQLTQPVSLPNTGGWHNWQTVSVENLDLAAGESQLKLVFLTGGFNIQYMEFVQTSAVKQGFNNPSLPEKIVLAQNYPNPFNSNTRIGYGLCENAHVKLEILNSSGQLISTPINERKKSGWYYFELGNDNTFAQSTIMTSGLYFYRLQVAGDHNNFSNTKKMLYIK